ncbi:MAG: TonB-dependent receptor [Pseudomonadota bacterium]
MPHSKFILYSTTLIAGTLAAPLPTAAQDDAAFLDDLETILVKARRREESIQTVPISVSSFDTDTLQQRSIITTQDLTFVTPGLVVAPALSRDVPAFVIRGQQRQADGTGSPAVVTYFADVPLSVQGSILPTFDVQSMQVLKGPQGTLFGRNTTGGAVLLYPNSPTYDLGGYGRISYGRFDEVIAETALNVPAIDDKLAIRVAGQRARRDGYTENLATGGEVDDRDTWSFRGSVLWEPNETITNTFIGDYYEANEAGTSTVLTSLYPNGVITDGGVARGPLAFLLDSGIPGLDVDLNLAAQQENGIRTVNPDFELRSNRVLWGITNTTEVELEQVTFKNIFGYRSTFVDSSRDFDGTPAPINNQSGVFASDQITNEFQVFGDLFADRVTYIAGVFYLEETPDEPNNGSSVIFFGPNEAELYFENKSTALFAETSIKLDEVAEGLKLNIGFRYTWDDITRCNGPISGSYDNCLVANAAGVTSTESSAPTWNIGLDYQVNDDVFVYFATRRGYRGAGPNGTDFSAFPELENFDEETVTDFELGLKTNFAVGDAQVTFNIAGYISNFEDIQRTLVTPATIDVDGDGATADNPFTLVVNAAQASINGIEAETSVRFNDYVTAGGFLNYTDAGFDEFSVIPELASALSLGTGLTADDTIFSYVPEFTAGAYLNARYPLEGIGSLALDVNLYHSGEVNFNNRPGDPAATEDGYTLVNLRTGIVDIADKISITGFVRNLFDEEYQAAAGFAVPTFTTATSVFGEPRIYGFEAQIEF